MAVIDRLVVLAVGTALTACSVSADPPSPAKPEATTKRTASALAVAPKSTFSRAVCVCGDLNLAGSLTTEAAPGQSADVGVTGDVSMATQTKIAGALLAGGAIGFSGEVDIARDLIGRRDISGSGELAVGAGLSCGGSITTSGSIKVKGALAAAGEVSHAGDREIGSTKEYAPETVVPCGCDAFDVAGAVALAKDTNDDGAHAIDPKLAAVGESTITLEAGRYYFEDAAAVGKTRFAIKGAVSIYVDGSLDLVGESNFEIADGGTLDLYVSGSVGHAGTVVAGNAKDPSAFRLYVGGKDAIVAGAGEATFYGFIYAPDAHVAFSGTTRVEGALFAKGLDYAGDLAVKYSAPTERPDASVCAEMPESYESPLK